MTEQSIKRLAHNISERMVANGFIDEEDEAGIATAFSWVTDEIEKRLASEVIESYNLYPRKCDATGKGIHIGYLVQESIYLSDGQEDKLLEYCKEAGYNSTEEAYKDGFYYWTEWSTEMDELEEDCYAYDEEGNEYQFHELERNWIKIDQKTRIMSRDKTSFKEQLNWSVHKSRAYDTMVNRLNRVQDLKDDLKKAEARQDKYEVKDLKNRIRMLRKSARRMKEIWKF